MRYTWIDEYLLKKRAVEKDLKKEWNWIRYQIGGKMFAAICLDRDDRPYYINLKLEPLEGEFLRTQYPDIIPGYYSDKRHWNSVNPDGEVPDDLLKDLLDKSYQLVLAGLSKKKQQEIRAERQAIAEKVAALLVESAVTVKDMRRIFEMTEDILTVAFRSPSRLRAHQDH